jgi:N-acetylmuramoyl-L-alanine amidase
LLGGLSVVDVADGDGERIGGVGGLRGLVELQQPGDHELDLLLGCEAVAYDRAFDGEWSVFGYREAAVGGGEHSYAANLAELERALGVGGEEDLFNGDDVGLPELQERSEFSVNLREPDGGLVFLVELYSTRAEIGELLQTCGVIDLHDAIAGKLCSAVDAEDPHGYEFTAVAGAAVRRESGALQSNGRDWTGRHLTTLKTMRYLQAALLVVATFPCLAQTPIGAPKTIPAVKPTAKAAAKAPARAIVPKAAPKPLSPKPIVAKAVATKPAVVRHIAPKVVVPAAPAALFNRSVIFLDPSHGGVDSGSRIGDSVLEKDVTLAFAFKLRSLLSARGFTVVMTRDADAPSEPNSSGTPLTLDDRAGIANHSRAVACLLIHATGSGTGVHLYSSELDAADAIPATVPWLSAQAPWVPQSQLLKKQIALAMSRASIPLVNSNASVRPVDSLTCPALVVEIAPQTDDTDTINYADYQQKIAEAIAGALVFWQNQAQSPLKLSAPQLPSLAEAPGVQP